MSKDNSTFFRSKNSWSEIKDKLLDYYLPQYPYGIKALDYGFFSKFADYGFFSIELLINMNSFGFMRAAYRALRVEYILDESLDDLVEYEPTLIDANKQSIELLNSIAGGE
jgi:hypothetical protein